MAIPATTPAAPLSTLHRITSTSGVSAFSNAWALSGRMETAVKNTDPMTPATMADHEISVTAAGRLSAVLTRSHGHTDRTSAIVKISIQGKRSAGYRTRK